jgi:hypothetical protein
MIKHVISIQITPHSVFNQATFNLTPEFVNLDFKEPHCFPTQARRHLSSWAGEGSPGQVEGLPRAPKPVSLAFEFSRPVDPSVQRSSSFCYVGRPHTLNKQLTLQTSGLSSSRGGRVWGVLARCTKLPASPVKLARGSVSECLLACRGLIKIRSRKGVLQVLPQHPPIRPRTCHSTYLSHRLLLALR